MHVMTYRPGNSCSNGAPLKGRIGWNLQRLQHQTNCIIEENRQGGARCSRASVNGMISRACRPGSDRSLVTWTPWTAAAAQKFAVGLEFAVLQHSDTFLDSLISSSCVSLAAGALQSEQPAQPSHTSCLVCQPTSEFNTIASFSPDHCGILCPSDHWTNELFRSTPNTTGTSFAGEQVNWGERVSLTTGATFTIHLEVETSIQFETSTLLPR